MKIQVALVSTPEKNNAQAIYEAYTLNHIFFKGCDKPPLEDDYIWFAKNEHKLVLGFASLRIVKTEKIGYLDRVAVLAKYRGNGLQRKFISVRVAYAKKLGLKAVVTYTVPDNYASINSLMHQGFSIYCPEWQWAGKEMLYFRRLISP